MKGVRLRNAQAEAAAATGPAEPGAGGAAGVRPAARWPAGWIVAVIPALAELIVGGYRIGVPSLWRDEAATISGSHRSLGAIATMMRHEDAVHAPYYVLMHPVIAVGGTSATVLRLPSLIAMTLAVGLTAALGRRLAMYSRLPGATAAGASGGSSPWASTVGLLAGLALTAVPLTTRYAQEARPYALATLFAVAATYAFVLALASPRRRWWGGYAAALLLAGLFNLFAVLIVVAHGASLLWLGRTKRAGGGAGVGAAGQGGAGRASAGQGGASHGGAGQEGQVAGVTQVVVRRWLAACFAAAVLLGPLIVLSAGQSRQLNWVRRPGLGTLAALVRDFAGTTVLIPVVAVLALLGCAAGLGTAGLGGGGLGVGGLGVGGLGAGRLGGGGLGAGGGARRPDSHARAVTASAVTPIALTPIALPWLVLPPVLLIVASFVHPYYVERYVLFCLPALAVLVATGLVWMVILTRRALAGRGLRPRAADVLAVLPSIALALIIVAVLVGPQREIRQVNARPDDLRAVAAVMARHERPGDAVLYLPRDTSLLGVAYPAAFRHLRDIGLGRSAVASGTLRGLAAPPRLVASRLAQVRRVWTVQWAHPLSRSTVAPSALTRLLAGLHLVGTWRVQSVVLRLYAASTR